MFLAVRTIGTWREIARHAHVHKRGYVIAHIVTQEEVYERKHKWPEDPDRPKAIALPDELLPVLDAIESALERRDNGADVPVVQGVPPATPPDFFVSHAID